AEQAGTFQNARKVTSAWLPWFRARVEKPTRPVLPGTVRPAAAPRKETTRRVQKPAAAAHTPPASESPSPQIHIPQGIKAGRREVTGVYQRPVGEAQNPLISEQPGARTKLDAQPLRLEPAVAPAPPALVAAPPALAPAPPVLPPSPDVPRKDLIEEWQALKVTLKQTSGEEREAARLREHDLRLMLESLAPADSMALILIRQQQMQKLGHPHACAWPIAEIERRFKDARRELDANWLALINGWMPAVHGEQAHVRGASVVYRMGPFDALVPQGTRVTPLAYPPLLWLIPDDEAVNFGSAPRVPMLGIDPRACRVDAPALDAPHTLTISFQPEERGGGYLPRPRARLLEMVVTAAPDEQKPAHALGHFMAKLLDVRKRAIEQLYAQQARQPLDDDAVWFFLSRLAEHRAAAPADRAAACKLLLQQLLKDAIFAIHPVEVRTGGLSEFLKISARVSLVPDLAQQVVQTSRMKPTDAATELDKAVRTVLAAVTRPQLHRTIFDPAARVANVDLLAPPSPYTGMSDDPAEPFAAAIRYWRANPVPWRPKS
ncbi:MAG: hypothetical protein AB7K09_26345, partial [Planctomycetota bacterium]